MSELDADFWVFDNENRHRPPCRPRPEIQTDSALKRLHLAVCLDFEARFRFSGLQIEILADNSVDLQRWSEANSEVQTESNTNNIDLITAGTSTEEAPLYHIKLLLSSKYAPWLHKYRILRHLSPSLLSELKLDPSELRTIYSRSYPNSAAEAISYEYKANFKYQDETTYLNAAESWNVYIRILPSNTKRRISDLPEEIIRHIVSKMYAPGSNTIKCARCILPFSSISRDWYFSVIDLLWNRPEWSTTVLKPHRFPKLMEVIRSNQDFVSRITSFPYIEGRTSDAEKQKKLLKDSDTIFGRARNLRYIHTFPPFIRYSMNHISTLEKLEFFSVSEYVEGWSPVAEALKIADIAKIINQMKHLRVLKLPRLYISWASENTGFKDLDLPEARYSLNSLSLDGTTVPTGFLAHLFSGPVQSLRTLKLSFVNGLTNSDLNHIFSRTAHTLEYIEIQDCVTMQDVSQEHAFDIWAPEMQRLKKALIQGTLLSDIAIANQPRTEGALFLRIFDYDPGKLAGLKDAAKVTGWKVMHVSFKLSHGDDELGTEREDFVRELEILKEQVKKNGVDFRYTLNNRASSA